MKGCMLTFYKEIPCQRLFAAVDQRFHRARQADRRSCEYEAYLPDPLVARRFASTGTWLPMSADAEAAIARLNAEGASLANTEALARILAPSRGRRFLADRRARRSVPARLLHAEVARGLDESTSDVTATEVLGNIDAMVYGIESVDLRGEIAVDLLLKFTAACSPAPGWKSARRTVPGGRRTGSAAAPTTRARPPSSRHPTRRSPS